MKTSQTLWALRLLNQSRKNRLPRGFERVQVVIEDLADFALQPGEVKPYDLSQFKPFDTIMFGQPKSVQVTRESLAMFRVMEGVESRSPGSLAFLSLIEAQPIKRDQHEKTAHEQKSDHRHKEA